MSDNVPFMQLPLVYYRTVLSGDIFYTLDFSCR